MAKCSLCGVEYPDERLEAGYDVCISCSEGTTPKMIGFTVFDHKTAPRTVLVDARNPEAVRIARRANRRAR